MSILHILETDTQFPEHFRYISGGYTLVINYTLVDEVIDIILAVIKPHDSKIESTISPFMFTQLQQHYDAELRAHAEKELAEKRELTSGKKTKVNP